MLFWRNPSARLARSWVMTLLLATFLAACGSSGGDPETTETSSVATSSTQPAETSTTGDGTDAGQSVTIGFLQPLTGFLAAAGEDGVRGWELYWEERGNTVVAGTEVEWHIADTAADPATAVSQANAMVSERGASMIVGPLSTAAGLAVAEEMGRQGIPVFSPQVSSDDLTQRQPVDNFYKLAGWGNSQSAHPFGEWAYDAGYRNIVNACFDLVFGYEKCGGFSRTFVEAGGTIAEHLWSPPGTEDFSALVTTIASHEPDAVFVGLSGADAVRFIEAYVDFGLAETIPLLGTTTTLDQAVIRSLGDRTVGMVSFGHFAEGRDEPETSQFVENYLEKHGELPSYNAAAMYVVAQWIVEALEITQGDVDEMDAFLDAIESIELEDSPLGPMQLDENNAPIQTVYIREVVQREDGLVWNVVIDQYDNVSQYWTYDPEEYLSGPPYSRDYQGY